MSTSVPGCRYISCAAMSLNWETVTRCARAGVTVGRSGSYTASPPPHIGDSSAKYTPPLIHTARRRAGGVRSRQPGLARVPPGGRPPRR